MRQQFLHDCVVSKRCFLSLALLLSPFLWGILPSFAFATVAISEVLWAGSDLSASDEWLELSCFDTPTTMSGFLLTGVNTSGTEVPLFTFPAEAIMSPGDSWVVSHYSAAHSRLSLEPRFVTSALSLPNTRLHLRLYDAAGRMVDEVDDEVGNPFAGTNASPPSFKESMERINLSLPGNDSANWRTAAESINVDDGSLVRATPAYFLYASFSSEPFLETQTSSSISPIIEASSLSSSSFDEGTEGTDGTEGTEVSASSSSLSSSEFSSATASSDSHYSFSSSTSVPSVPSMPSAPSSLRLSEILPNPPGPDDAEWIELHNSDSADIDLYGWMLTETLTKTSFLFDQHEILQPGEYRAFKKSRTGVSLPQAGGEVQLLWSGSLVQKLAYPALPEDISFGDAEGSLLRAFCIPTEGQQSNESAWGASLIIQSGSVSGVEPLSINTQVIAKRGTFTDARCRIVFGDGETSESCNPPSHSYDAGAFVYRAEITNYCGTTVTHTLPILALAKQSLASKNEEKPVSSVRSSSSAQASSTTSLVSTPARHDALLFYAVMPNPEGKDPGREWVSIMNVGSSSTPAQELLLTVQSSTARKTVHIHVPSLAPHESVKLSDKTLPVTLANENTTLTLSALDEYILDTISWAKVKENQTIGHPITLAGKLLGIVSKVIDGDTVDVTFTLENIEGIALEKTERVRLIGINTPETDSDFAQEKTKALEAKKFISALIEGKIIELQFDTNMRDVYGRLLAYLFTDTGIFVQKELVTAGYAVATDEFAHSRKDEFLSWQITAEEEQIGIWNTEQKISSIDHEVIEEEPFLESIKMILAPKKSSAKSSLKTTSPVVLSPVLSLDLADQIPEEDLSQTGAALPSLFADLIPQADAAFLGGTNSDAEDETFRLSQASIPLFIVGVACCTLWYLGKKRYLW